MRRLFIGALVVILPALLEAGCGVGTASLPGAASNGPDAGSPSQTGDAGTSVSTPDAGPPGPTAGVDGLDGLPKGSAQLAILCGRHNGDVVSTAFCASTPPAITSLSDLQAAIGLSLDPTIDVPSHGANPAFAISGHSTSLVKRLTSAINPRTILMSNNGEGRHTPPRAPLPNFVALGFVRGEQFVELAAQDQSTLRFFLFTFEQACTHSPAGCTPNDLFTPAIEKNFTAYTLYEDVDIKNTTMDCLQCHQTAGPGTPRILRMSELQAPWTHFFQDASATAQGSQGAALLADFHLAHGTSEDYGGLRAAMFVNGSRPQYIEAPVEAQSGQNQPNQFLGLNILNELPNPTAPCLSSATWTGIFTSAANGNDIPVPSCRERVTDPTKLSNMTQAYAAWRSNPAAQLPDVSDVLLDSALVEMGIRPQPGLDGHGIVVQICQECHNNRLDQTISRSHFNVETLSQLSRGEKDEAIRRLGLPDTSPQHMPPRRFKELSPSDIALATQELLK